MRKLSTLLGLLLAQGCSGPWSGSHGTGTIVGRRAFSAALLLLAAAAGCVRAPPPVTPFASGGVVQSASSDGQIILGLGAATDGWTASGTAASASGRFRLSPTFDLGIGGSYGASGLPRTWIVRLSPRLYVPTDVKGLMLAFETGLSCGVYEGADLNPVSSPPVTIGLQPLGSADALFRFGFAPRPDWEIFGGAGPFLTVGGTPDVFYDGALYHVGALSEFGVQWTHPSGWTVGVQGNFSAGYAPNILGFNVTYGGLVTVGYRFGYVSGK